LDPITKYAEDIAEEKILACKYHRQACERHLRDLSRGKYVWNTDAGNRVINFIENLRHHKGRQFAGNLFILEPWQTFLLGSVFGWQKKTGGRRYKESYTEIPRKNGKTALGAGVGIFGLTADQEPGAEIYSIASKRDQAAICWDASKRMIEVTPGLKERIKTGKASVWYNPLGNKFVPLSKDTKKMDGLNPHIVIGDETHAWEDRMLYDQIDDAFGSREQPLFFLITTAGNNMEGVCFDLRKHVIAILEGNEDESYMDEEYFGFICTLDKDDDWKDESVWIKANPNLGVSKDWDYLRRQVKKAQQIPSKKNAVLNKQFNIWTEAGETWLDMDRWKENGKSYDLAKLAKEKCHMGIDLSTIQDITAVVMLFPPGVYKEWVIYPRMYIPGDNVGKKERADRVPYGLWVEQGYLQTTPGDVIDLDFIYEDILQMNEEYNVIDAGYDPWKAVELATKLDAEGMEVVQMRQGHATLGAPSTEFEKKVMAKQFRHGGHPVLRWMAGNTVTISDNNENIRPDKKKSTKRIDGIVASIMALGRAMTNDKYKSIYENRGFIEDI
jgi:phage terminase large subunit-like protein